jgi:hypothetical protein
LGHREVWDLLRQQDLRATRDVLGQQDQLVLRETEDQLEELDLKDLLGHLVRLVTRVHQVTRAIPVTQDQLDLLEIQAWQVAQDHLGSSVSRV